MGHHHGSDTPTSAGAVLLHTDQKGPNILTRSVLGLNIIRASLNFEMSAHLLFTAAGNEKCVNV